MCQSITNTIAEYFLLKTVVSQWQSQKCSLKQPSVCYVTKFNNQSRQGIDSQHIKRRDHSIEIAIQNIPIGLPAQTKNKIEQKKTKKHEAVI